LHCRDRRLDGGGIAAASTLYLSSFNSDAMRMADAAYDGTMAPSEAKTRMISWLAYECHPPLYLTPWALFDNESPAEWM